MGEIDATLFEYLAIGKHPADAAAALVALPLVATLLCRRIEFGKAPVGEAVGVIALAPGDAIGVGQSDQ